MQSEPALSQSPLEVEQKYRVLSHQEVLRRLVELQASELTPERQCDTYLQHPSRDFGVTGEAFRIREVNEDAVVTYKGARLAGAVKTRSEIEIALAVNTQREWMQVWLALGFREVAQVRKQRRSFVIPFESTSLTIALDDVVRLGTFVEVEAIVHDRTTLPEIQQHILDVAKLLGLNEVEPRSYLRQLLEQDH